MSIVKAQFVIWLEYLVNDFVYGQLYDQGLHSGVFYLDEMEYECVPVFGV